MIVTRRRLAADLRALGVREGGTLMVHTAMSSLGHVVGGAGTVVRALLDCLGPDGTLCAQVSWDPRFPPFVPGRTPAAPYEGRIPERIRTWPGAHRSANPATGVAAVGRHAAALTAGHRLDDGFGRGTPYERVEQVALLGAPLHTISLLHHAESIAGGRTTTYRAAMPGGDVEIRELDVWRGAFPYELGTLAAEALAAGAGRAGPIGGARGHVFEAGALVRFAVDRLAAVRG